MHTGDYGDLLLCKYYFVEHTRFLVVQDYYDAMSQLTVVRSAAKISRQINVYEESVEKLLNALLQTFRKPLGMLHCPRCLSTFRKTTTHTKEKSPSVVHRTLLPTGLTPVGNLWPQN